MIKQAVHNCVKNHCNICGWEGCYCELLIDDRTFSDGIPEFVCPQCRGRDISYLKYYRDYIPSKKSKLKK